MVIVARILSNVGGMQTFAIDTSDTNGVDTVRVAIEVAVVVCGSSISDGEDEYTAKTRATLLDAFQHGSSDENAWCFHGLAIIRWPPRARIDLCLLVCICHGFCFVDVRDDLAENTYASDSCLVCDANTTDIVPHSSNLSCTSCSMAVVCQTWLWIWSWIVVVPTALSTVIVLEVIAVQVQAVVHDANSATFALDTLLPDTGNIDVVTRLDVVVQVPLFQEDGIIDAQVQADLLVFLQKFRHGIKFGRRLGTRQEFRRDWDSTSFDQRKAFV
ncbi:hypothetical protein AC579_7736 [Pseudocercospora musae]|uniref:Uncharacterized protein n=1 Tax=Pseudocercospora musae TaxID=113226 RepID=A0A139IK01_9PEZI|nr:hypothetical protein AC579_7736 [Pseudocercospora musae]